MKQLINKRYFSIVLILVLISCSKDNPLSGTVWVQHVKRKCPHKEWQLYGKTINLKKIEFVGSNNVIINDSLDVEYKVLNDTLGSFLIFEKWNDEYDTIYLKKKNDTTLIWYSTFWERSLLLSKRNKTKPENFNTFMDRIFADTSFQFQRMNIPVLTAELDDNDFICSEEYKCNRMYLVRADDVEIKYDSISDNKMNVVIHPLKIKKGFNHNLIVEFTLIYNEWYLTKRSYYMNH